jgi:hypothetical protein
MLDERQRLSACLLLPLVAYACGGKADADAATRAEPAVLRALPVHYLADRFAVAPVTAGGDTLELYTDTGGGMNMLWAPTAQRLGLTGEAMQLDGESAELVSLPAFDASAGVPLPRAPAPIGARLAIVPRDSTPPARDGFLGRHWFRDRIWVFDYPGRTLGLLSRSPDATVDEFHQVPLGFQRSRFGFGPRTTHFPRIRIGVDGDSLDLLFDTGAMVSLTDSAVATLASFGAAGPAERGASFIAQSVFDGWRRRHPDWRVVAGADRPRLMPMIEVPLVQIGGYEVGPVWFTMRPDANFHDYMSQWMDRRIDGALGGSALRYFRVTVDYPRATARFERP